MDRPLKALSGWHIVILLLAAASYGADASANQHKAGATHLPGLSCITGGLRLRGGNSQVRDGACVLCRQGRVLLPMLSLRGNGMIPPIHAPRYYRKEMRSRFRTLVISPLAMF